MNPIPLNIITVLPPGTFSHLAISAVMKALGLDFIKPECFHVTANAEIIPTMIEKNHGFALIAGHTSSGGALSSTLAPLATAFAENDKSVILPRILGAVRIPINFALILRKGITPEQVTHIIGHERAITACKDNIKSRGAIAVEAKSNVEGIAKVSSDDPLYQTYAALGPTSSVPQNCFVAQENFEDKLAVTTFYLLSRSTGSRASFVPCKLKRALLVFTTPHEPNGLGLFLTLFGSIGFNSRYIQSIHVGDDEYYFVVEYDVPAEREGFFSSMVTELEGQGFQIQSHVFPVIG